MTKESLLIPQKIGVREIAKRIGVVPITVSRVLFKPEMVSEETRERVLQAID